MLSQMLCFEDMREKNIELLQNCVHKIILPAIALSLAMESYAKVIILKHLKEQINFHD